MKRLRKGQILKGIPAADWNQFVATAEGFSAMRAMGKTDSSEPPSRSPTTVPIKNTTGGALGRFAVVGLDSILFGPDLNLSEFKNNFAFVGYTPAAGTHEGKFAIVQEPVASGKIATRAAVAGVTVCKLYVTAESDTHAEIADGDTAELKTGTSGSARILWKEAGTGTGKWAVVRLGETVTEKLTGEGEGGVLLDKWIEADPTCEGIPCRTCYLEEKDEADPPEYIPFDWRGRQIWCELAGYWSNAPGSDPNNYAWTLVTGSKHVIGCTWDPGQGVSDCEDDLLLGQLDLTQGVQTIRGQVFLEAGSGRIYFMTAGAGDETELADFRVIIWGSGRLCEPNHECDCPEDCSTCDCDESDLNNVTVSSTVTCVSGSYSSGSGSGGQWNWNGGYCDGDGPWGTATDFFLYTKCEEDGTWTVKIIAYVAGVACFLLADIKAGAGAGEITCVGGQFSGSVTLAGQDTTGDGGPDLTGETATVVF